MHWHWQNLNRDDQTDKVIGSGFWHGRAWLYLNSEPGNRKQQIGVSWCFGGHARHTMLQLHTNFVMDRELVFSIGLWHVFCFWLTLGFPFFPSWSYKHGDRNIGLRIFSGALWIDLWRNEDDWYNKTWWWQRKKPIVIDPANILLGREQHSQQSLSVQDVTITLPGGSYPATIEMYLSIWKRPRWPFVRRIRRANVEMHKPIPVPGKGENSWDLDDDAIMGMTCPANSIEEAIAHVIQSALRDRRRYGGGHDWKPEVEAG